MKNDFRVWQIDNLSSVHVLLNCCQYQLRASEGLSSTSTKIYHRKHTVLHLPYTN